MKGQPEDAYSHTQVGPRSLIVAWTARREAVILLIGVLMLVLAAGRSIS
jgi:hypothetical protein